MIELQIDLLVRQPFLDGQDWRNLAMVNRTAGIEKARGGSADTYIVGVRDDRSLRLVAVVREGSRFASAFSDMKLDPGTNWVSVVSYGPELVALKSDGTLWKWKLPPDNDVDKQALVRVGARSDWVAVSGIGGDVLALSADGTIWDWKTQPPWNWPGNELLFPPLISVSTRAQRVANIFDAHP